MANIIARHRVSNFDSWKAIFDSVVDMRRDAGERSYTIWRSTEEPNNVFLHFAWDSAENARNYFGSPDLKNAMHAAGVIEEPEIHFLEEAASGTL